MNTIEIRKPEISDLDFVFELWKKQHDLHVSLDPRYYKANSPELDDLAREDLRRTINAENMRVARLDERIYAFMSLRVSRADSNDGLLVHGSNITDYIEVVDLYVDQDVRGLGIGRLLMSEAEDFCRQQQLSTLKVAVSFTNEQARDFYQEIGYHPIQVEMIKQI